MEYVVGSVAELISGNVTPSRPKIIKTALTPMKHPRSPNVTPKSEFVDDRSVFLSPSLQKKKAIIKKSPKRIFQTQETDDNNENAKQLTSPKAEKVKKHLKNNCWADDDGKFYTESSNISIDNEVQSHTSNLLNQGNYEQPKKKKRKDKSKNKITDSHSHLQNDVSNTGNLVENCNEEQQSTFSERGNIIDSMTQEKHNKKKQNKIRKSREKLAVDEIEADIGLKNCPVKSKSKKLNKNFVNPNAITHKDTDSEHDSDNEIESENESTNRVVLDTNNLENESSDEENIEHKTNKTKKDKERTVAIGENYEQIMKEELKRTLFISNVLFNKKCKKEIKKIFEKYGPIDSVRIRTVPVKDARVTPKLAVLRNELHPERTTVNVYVKYKNASSVDEALVENNTVLNEHHLRVARCDSGGLDHDPRCSIFVGNVPFAIEDEVFREKFEKCGEIHSVRIIRDKKTNAGKGFGYVNFKSRDGVELALSMSEEDLTIKNRIMRVKRCTHLNHKKGQQNKTQGYGQQSKTNVKNFQNRGNKDLTKKQVPDNEGKSDGAYRRIMNKRKNQDGSSEGPPNKKQKNLNQPQKEKKTRKEFVGLTAEKKKKHKFSKGQKKKKVLSEILMK